MNKRDAKNSAYNSEYTIGDLRSLITKRRNKGGLEKPSNINRGLSVEQAIGILERAIEGRDSEETPKTTRIAPGSDRVTLSGDGLLVQNILRVCG